MMKSNQSSMRLWQIFLQRSLGLANVLNKKIFVVHGGLFSSDDIKLSDFRAINMTTFESPIKKVSVSKVSVTQFPIVWEDDNCLEHVPTFWF